MCKNFLPHYVKVHTLLMMGFLVIFGRFWFSKGVKLRNQKEQKIWGKETFSGHFVCFFFQIQKQKKHEYKSLIFFWNTLCKFMFETLQYVRLFSRFWFKSHHKKLIFTSSINYNNTAWRLMCCKKSNFFSKNYLSPEWDQISKKSRW